MSLALVIRCDLPGPYGTCGAYLPTGTTDEAEAYAVAARVGWSTGPDRCPGHTIRRLRPPTTKENPFP